MNCGAASLLLKNAPMPRPYSIAPAGRTLIYNIHNIFNTYHFPVFPIKQRKVATL